MLQGQKSTGEERRRCIRPGPRGRTIRLLLHKDRLGIGGNILMVRSKGKPMPRVGKNSSRNAFLPLTGWSHQPATHLPNRSVLLLAFLHIVLSKLWWTCLRERKSNLWGLCVAVISAITCSVHRHWVAEEDMVSLLWAGHQLSWLVAEGLLHGGYFLLGINLNWKDLATLVLP